MNQPEYVQEPEDDNDNHHQVQNGLDAPSHGDEAIHEPQQNANDDQYSYKINQGHDRLLLSSQRTHGPTQGRSCFRVCPRGYATNVERSGTWNFWMVQAEAWGRV
jgi:hypothetical protein